MPALLLTPALALAVCAASSVGFVLLTKTGELCGSDSRLLNDLENFLDESAIHGSAALGLRVQRAERAILRC